MGTLIEQIMSLGKPESDEIEITTIGVGGFEGESIVVHFGDGKWGVIDSCKSQDDVNLPLLYLTKLGVSLDNVEVVVCTHWHSDHIHGLSEVLEACPNATFDYPIVGQDNNLLRYLIGGNEAQGSSSVWKEFLRCINMVDERRVNYGYADRVVYDHGNGTMLVSLSPSKKMLDEMHQILVQYDSKENGLSQINESVITPNMCSSALLLCTLDTCVLLGADLEANRYEDEILACVGKCAQRWEKGWCNIMQTSRTIRSRKASFFKLPHHSSKTGYCDEVWSNHITEDPVSVTTVYINNAGVKLPKKEMLTQYKDLSSELFMTSAGPKKKDNKREHGKSRLDENKSDKLRSIAVMNEERGIVCSRKKIGEHWTTQLLGTAIHVDDCFIKQYQDN